MGVQAREAQDKKLTNLHKQPIYEVKQICNQLDETEEQASKAEDKGGYVSMDKIR